MRKWIVLTGSAILIVCSFFIWTGVRVNLFPNVRGQMFGGIAVAFLSAFAAMLGVVLILRGITSKQSRCNTHHRISVFRAD